MDTQQPKGRDLAGWVQQLHDEHARWKEEEVSLEALEAFVNTARQVYERAVILKHLAMAEARNQATVSAPVAPTEVAMPETPETAPGEPKESLAEPAVEPLAEPAAEPPSSPLAEPARRWTFQPLVSPTEPAPSAPAPAPSEPAPAPTATAATPSAGGGTSLAQQLKQTGIPALAPALGINDRVRFAGVFASGDVPAFLKFCAEIEALPNLEAAELRLRAAAGPQVDWEDESGTAFAMLQLVKRLRQFLPA
jgi:hypothetical protein